MTTTPQPSTDKREEIARIIGDNIALIDALGMVCVDGDSIGRAADAIMALPPLEHGWRDIASAPKDGTRVLMWGPGWDSPMTHEWLNAEIAAAELRNWIDPPTHWRPLPAPPSNPETKGEA